MNSAVKSLRPAVYAAAGILFLLSAPAAAENLKPFFGHYTGAGIAKSKQTTLLGLKERDLDVVIEPSGDGMSITWTTVVKKDGAEVKRSTTTIVFQPTDDPKVFKAPERDDPLGASGYSWAALDGNTMTVYILAVNAKTGSYNLHSYERTLKGATGMELKFLRINDGRPKVIVQGNLKRN